MRALPYNWRYEIKFIGTRGVLPPGRQISKFEPVNFLYETLS